MPKFLLSNLCTNLLSSSNFLIFFPVCSTLASLYIQFKQHFTIVHIFTFSLALCLYFCYIFFLLRFVSAFYREPNRGYGGNVTTVFRLLRAGDCSEPHGPAAAQFDCSGSYGNGGAMRIVPAALFGMQYTEEKLNVCASFYSSLDKLKLWV